MTLCNGTSLSRLLYSHIQGLLSWLPIMSPYGMGPTWMPPGMAPHGPHQVPPRSGWVAIQGWRVVGVGDNSAGKHTPHTCFSHTFSIYTLHIYTHYIFKNFFPEPFLESHQLELCKAPRNRQCCPSSSFWPSRMTVLMRLMPFRSTMSTKGSSNKANHGVLWWTQGGGLVRNGQLDWECLTGKKTIYIVHSLGLFKN